MIVQVNPLVSALVVLGYGLAVPIGFRLVRIVREQSRVAFLGHQIGVIIAGLGWLIKPSIAVAIVHALWVIGTRLWFQYGTWRSKKAAAP